MNFKATMVVVLGLVLGFFFVPSLRAQVAGATLTGAVTDAQGGVVPSAKVSVRNQGTGVTVETTTNAAGAYAIPNLIPADYEVSVSAPGFSTAVSKVTLAVGAKQELNIPLTVGQITQTVEVAAVAPQIELTSSTISDEVTATTVRELPLNGRDWASLAQLQPSVVEARTHLDVTHVGGGGGRGFGDQLSIGGGRPTQNSYRLDGAIVNDYSNAGPGSVLGANLGVDAIQEFSVLTSNYSAEYGFTSGGVINAITKSGTNSFHGTAFEFLRNDKFDAANFFNNAGGLGKNPLRQNQFGAAGGWKVLRDKLWLFGNYEGVRLSAGIPISSNISFNDNVRKGIVTNVTNGDVINLPAGTVTSTGGAVTNFTPTPIDANIQKFLALYPHPTGAAQDANVALAPFQGHRAATENFLTARADYKLSDKDSIFATFLRDNSSFNSPLNFNDDQQAFTSYRQVIIVEETHVFSASWTNTVRGALDRTNNLGGNSPTVNNPAASDPSLAQLPGYFSSQITLTGTGVTTLPGGQNYGASIQDYWGQIRQFYDDAFHQRGNHGFKFGFSFLAQQVDGYTPLAGGNGSGTFSFRGTYDKTTQKQTATAAQGVCKGDSSCGTFVNFLTNEPLGATRPIDLTVLSKHYLRDKVISGYFQDDWRLLSNLTLNLGLRYEVSTIPWEKYGKVAVMPTPQTPLPCNAPPSCSTTDPASALRNTFFTHNPTLKNFEPRIGFAWDPFHNGKTSVRGGFGIFDALPLPYELILNNNSSAPWRPTFAPLGPTGGGLQNSPPSIAAGTATTTAGEWPYVVPSLTAVHNLNPLSRSFQYVEPTPHRNYVYQYNFNVQRQITPTLSILVGYTGSRALHNPFQSDTINTIVPTFVNGIGYAWPGCPGGIGSTEAQLKTAYDACVAAAAGSPTGGSLYTQDGNIQASQQNARLLNPNTAAIMYNTDWQARSWYNAMQIKVDKRMSHGFQVQGAYTWSKSIDDSSGSTAGDTFQLDIVSEPFYDMSLNKGLSDFDVRHNFVVNGLWNVPGPKSLGAFGDKALGGWQLGIISTLGSGIPGSASFTAFNNASDFAGELITTNQPPNLNPGCSPQGLVNPNYRHSLLYINQSCLGLVPLTTANASVCDNTRPVAHVGAKLTYPGFPANACPNIRGNLGRDTIIGPGLFNMDFSVFKNTHARKISEAFNVQFRADMFNVLNHTNFYPPSNLNLFHNINAKPDPTFGLLTSTQTPNRIIQLALKMVW